MWIGSKRPACSERCKLDLPGFKNLEGLHVGMFITQRQVRDCRNDDIPQILVYAWSLRRVIQNQYFSFIINTIIIKRLQ